MNWERRYLDTREHLLRRVELESRGVGSRSLEKKVREGSLMRVYHGWYVSSKHWDAWASEKRHFAQVIAAHENARVPPLFSHISAAVLHDLPVYAFGQSRVHMTSSQSARASSSPAVLRHRARGAPAEIRTTRGLRVTAPDRVVEDCARTESFVRAVVIADAVLNRFAREGRAVDQVRVDAWRERMRFASEASAKGPGTSRFRRVIEFADARADSVLESVSRLQLYRLGFDIESQVRVESPREGSYFVDFELVGTGFLAECDGKQKYTSAELLRDESAEERVYREKRREDWIRGVTGKRIVRWGSADVMTPERLARRLSRFGVPLPRRRRF